MTRVLVLYGFGLNCEEETAAAYTLACATPTIAHAADWFDGRVQLASFDVLHLPGGFSFGDNLGAGRVLANRLRFATRTDGSKVWDELLAFLGRGGRVLGVCNGFQALVKSGLLPNVGEDYTQEVSLAANATGHFTDRWVQCRLHASAWQGAEEGIVEFPIRHGEGRIVFGSEAIQRAVVGGGLVLLSYVDANGAATTEHPANPNGSPYGIAGLRSKDGRVLGLMPHPEGFLFAEVHPGAERRASGRAPDGLQLFESFLQSLKE